MKLSILILTHNRPELFKRCIASVSANKPDWAEIIVNNDTNDITEDYNIDYYYEKHDDLSETYKFLFDKAQGEYIYFLEDDDYVLESFWEIIRKIEGNTIFRYLPENNFDNYYNFFKEDADFQEHFQLSQMVFKKSSVKDFPVGNHLNNDYMLYSEIDYNEQFIVSKKTIFVQTTDGKDNLSFPQYNKDKRFV